MPVPVVIQCTFIEMVLILDGNSEIGVYQGVYGVYYNPWGKLRFVGEAATKVSFCGPATKGSRKKYLFLRLPPLISLGDTFL